MAFESSISVITDLVESWPLFNDDETEGDDHIRNLKRAVRLLRLGVPGSVPPSQPALDTAGNVNVDASVMEIMPKAGDAGGTLNSLTPGDAYIGSIVCLFAQNPAFPITVHHATSGANHLELRGGSDFVLDSVYKCIFLRQKSGKWVELDRALNAAGSASERDVGVASDTQLPDRLGADGRYARLDIAERTFVDTTTDLPIVSWQRTNVSTPSKGSLRALSSKVQIGAVNGVPLEIIQNDLARMTVGASGGLVVGAATSGDLGVGTVNTQGVFTNGVQHAIVKLSEATASVAGQLDVVLPTTTYRMLHLLLDGWVPSTDQVDLFALLSFDGSTFPTSGYLGSIDVMRSAGGTNNATDTTQIPISLPSAANHQSNNGLYSLSAELYIPRVTGKVQNIWGTVAYCNATAFAHGRIGAQGSASSGLAQKIRLKYSSGNIAAGRATLFGVL